MVVFFCALGSHCEKIDRKSGPITQVHERRTLMDGFWELAFRGGGGLIRIATLPGIELHVRPSSNDPRARIRQKPTARTHETRRSRAFCDVRTDTVLSCVFFPTAMRWWAQKEHPRCPNVFKKLRKKKSFQLWHLQSSHPGQTPDPKKTSIITRRERSLLIAQRTMPTSPGQPTELWKCQCMTEAINATGNPCSRRTLQKESN